LHHLPSVELRLKALEDLRSLLKSNGLLIFTCWNLYNQKYRPYILKYSALKFFPKIVIPNVKSTDLDFKDVFIPWKKTDLGQIVMRYYHAFSLRELAKLVKAAGFKMVTQFYSKQGQISTLWQAHNLIVICRAN
jgi:hypothetical protein